MRTQSHSMILMQDVRSASPIFQQSNLLFTRGDGDLLIFLRIWGGFQPVKKERQDPGSRDPRDMGGVNCFFKRGKERYISLLPQLPRCALSTSSDPQVTLELSIP